MTASELIKKVRDILAEDKQIEDFCLGQYYNEQTVCVDIDEENPPDPVKDYPVIAITDIRKRYGKREIIFDLDLAVAVFQEEIESINNTRTMLGFIEVQTLLELCEDALYRANIALDTTDRGGTQSLSRYPLFTASAVFSFKQIKINRRR